MGKRLRSMSVCKGEQEIRISRHAMDRFRQRVKCLPYKSIPHVVSSMLKDCRPLYPDKETEGVFLAHRQCVFVLSRAGVIQTVLPPNPYHIRLYDSVKEMRQEQKRLKRKPEYKRAKTRRLRRRRDRRKRQRMEIFEHDIHGDEDESPGPRPQ